MRRRLLQAIVVAAVFFCHLGDARMQLRKGEITAAFGQNISDTTKPDSELTIYKYDVNKVYSSCLYPFQSEVVRVHVQSKQTKAKPLLVVFREDTTIVSLQVHD